MNLWLIPASDDAADANIMKTLAAPISRERAEAAGIESGTRAWGAKASSDANVNRFRKMRAGDCCLFYTKLRGGGSKRYCWKGVISKTIESKKISKALWDNPDFELVYFLKDVAPIDTQSHQAAGADDQQLRDTEERHQHRRGIGCLVVERRPQTLARAPIVSRD